MQTRPLVTVITASVGHKQLGRCIESVSKQTYPNIQHLIFSDGPEADVRVRSIAETHAHPSNGVILSLVSLPYSVGKDRWNGHRMYAAGTFLAEGAYVCFLDDDNYFDLDHIESCLETVRKGAAWAYSFRKIIDREGNFRCNDDCESLGQWPSVLSPDDYFIDVNCYFLPKGLAVSISPVWYRKFRESGQIEVDRALCQTLTRVAPRFGSNGRYSLNYTVGNSANSVTLDFFERGNLKMLDRYGGDFPWRARIVT